MTHALARLLASVSRRINAHLSTYGRRLNMFVYPRSCNAYLTSHRKAATHNCRIQVPGNIKGQGRKSHDNLFTNPSIARTLPTVTSIYRGKYTLLSIFTHKSLIESTRSRIIPPNMYENSIG
jgi:hypothetical protein